MLSPVSFVCALVFLLLAGQGHTVNAEVINPWRILVTTVIDTSNKEIVRDALTLFRSIRLFGESFNQATFLAYITLEDSFVDNSALLANLSSLRINWDFVRPVDGYVPKTMNKILTFKKFDGLKYDYLLWLDADVVLFRDPIPYLYAHKYPGQIQCSPDVYNYLKRFPHLNGSNLVWSTELSEYQLDGHNEFSPHGLCNTGIILFDKLSLATFMGALNETMDAIRPVNPYDKDRFLDSLVFVAIVNRLNIDVIVRGYELNYMSFFEIEIQEAVDIDMGPIIFAHFITHTELYCTNEKSEHCRCVYHNTNLGKVSLIFNAMEESGFGGQSICRVLAGSMTMAEYQQLGYNTSISYVSNNTDKGIPSNRLARFPVPLAVEGAAVAVELALSWPPEGSMIFHDRAAGRVPVQLEWSCATPDSKSIHKLKFIYISLELFAVGEGVTPILLSSKRVQLDICGREPVVAWLDFNIEKQGKMDPTILNTFYRIGETPVQLKVTILSAPFVEDTVTVMTANLTLFQKSLAYPGLARFSDNLLLGRRPMQLASQLDIPDYLNMWRHGVGRYGAVVCCDTTSGVAVVENLISRWEGSVLVIYMRRLPNFHPTHCPGDQSITPSMQDWMEYFNDLCRLSKSGVRCAIFDQSEDVDSRSDIHRHGMYLLNKHDISFAYIDVFEGYHDHRDGIIRWLDLLPKGSILFGSQYTHHHPSADCALEGASVGPCMSGPRSSVDAAAYHTRRVVLLTHAEESSGSDWSGSNKYCRSFRNIERIEYEAVRKDKGSDKCTALAATASTNFIAPKCALDSPFAMYSAEVKAQAGLPAASECQLRPSRSDCAPAWYFHVVSRPLDIIIPS